MKRSAKKSVGLIDNLEVLQMVGGAVPADEVMEWNDGSDDVVVLKHDCRLWYSYAGSLEKRIQNAEKVLRPRWGDHARAPMGSQRGSLNSKLAITFHNKDKSTYIFGSFWSTSRISFDTNLQMY